MKNKVRWLLMSVQPQGKSEQRPYLFTLLLCFLWGLPTIFPAAFSCSFFFLNLLPTSSLKSVDFYSLSEQKSGYLNKRMENRKPMSYIQACMQGICHNIIKGLLPSCQIISNANNLSDKIYKSLFASVNLPSSHFNLIHNFYLLASALWTFL